MRNKLGLMLGTLGAALACGDVPYGYHPKKQASTPVAPPEALSF